MAERHPGCPGRGLARGPDRASTPWALLELPVLVGSRLLAQRHLRRRAPTSTPALAILDHPIPWSRLELLAALPVTATAIYALAGVTLASPDRLRARQQTLIWSQTAIGWAGFLAALLAARRTGRGRVG